jgi:hypothetical protein
MQSGSASCRSHDWLFESRFHGDECVAGQISLDWVKALYSVITGTTMAARL